MKCERCHRPLSRTSAAGRALGPTCAKHAGLSPLPTPRPARGPQDDLTVDLFAPPTIAQQGHVYDYYGARVLALATGEAVEVGELQAGQPWFVSRYQVNAAALKPLPMNYFHGATPR